MGQAATLFYRNLFHGIKVNVKCYTKIKYSVLHRDAMIKDGVGKKHVNLLLCLDVPIIMKSVLSALSLSLLCVIQPEIVP